ncbi:MAG: hypothetical protein QNK04_15060 [Myxococcota bacterium]|nr:hypothetical protein [Myxococcota bacterium]
MTGSDLPMDRQPLGSRLLAGWNAIVARFGFAQTLVILALFYALMIGPVAIVASLARRDLLDRRRLRIAGSAWRSTESAGADLERAKHGY